MFTSRRITILVLAVTLLFLSTAMASQAQVYRPILLAAVAGTKTAESESPSPVGKYYKVSVNGGVYTGDYCFYFDPNGLLYGFVNSPGYYLSPPLPPGGALAAFWGAADSNYGLLGVTFWGPEGSILFLTGVFVGNPSLPFFGSGSIASVNCGKK